MRGATRAAVAGIAVVVALVLQVSVLPRLGWPDAGLGLVPDLVLLVVVGTALLTDTRFATLTGFFAGLLVDLAPPADHLAGRWALALMVVGYVVGRLAHDDTPSPGPRFGAGSSDADRGAGLGLLLLAAAAGSFVGTSVYAVTGLALGDGAAGVGPLLEVVARGVLLDLIAALVLAPLLLMTRRRMRRAAGAGRVSPRSPRQPRQPRPSRQLVP